MIEKGTQFHFEIDMELTKDYHKDDKKMAFDFSLRGEQLVPHAVLRNMAALILIRLCQESKDGFEATLDQIMGLVTANKIKWKNQG